jgi:pimeloyl-ACP methyl ester carboxylesterase
MKRRAIPILKVLALTVIALVIVLVCAGWIYEQAGRMRDRHMYPQVGRSVDVGGRKLNIYCSGEGGPAVIFEAGGEVGGYSWAVVQPGVAQFTLACWYDRAGEGWSDPPAGARTSASIVNDLHELLHRARVAPPYVLVGASVGGEYVHIFTAKFPDEVAGMVLVDSSHPDQHEPMSMKSQFNVMAPAARQFFCTAMPVLARLGFLRLTMGAPPGFAHPPLEPKNAATISRVMANRPEAIAATAEQSCAATDNGRNVPDGGTGNPEVDDAARRAGPLGDRPLLVLTAGRAFEPPDPDGKKESADFHEVWMHQLQPQLAALSTRGQQVIVPNSSHAINFDAPGEVVKGVRDVVDQVRGKSPDSTGKR